MIFTINANLMWMELMAAWHGYKLQDTMHPHLQQANQCRQSSHLEITTQVNVTVYNHCQTNIDLRFVD